MDIAVPATELVVLYEDNHCLALQKPARMLTVGDETGDVSLLDLGREYIKRKYQKPGDVFLGVVQRLDRPVSGVVLFARTSKAASRLAEQFRTRRVQKTYRAIVEGKVESADGECLNWLRKDPATNIVRIVPANSSGAKPARLRYRRLRSFDHRTLVEIHPETGRSHQIRVQLAAIGHPICGDRKYGSKTALEGAIALHAAKLEFEHPTRREPIVVTAPEPTVWSKLMV